MGKTVDKVRSVVVSGQETMDMVDTLKQISDALDGFVKRLNILVMGQTGVGKSTLVNAVFGKTVAEVKAGSTGTIGISKYIGDGVTIYDTEGLELKAEQQERITNSICSLIRTQHEKGIDDAIHMIWYCIAASSSRPQVTEFDLARKVVSAIKASSLNIPVIFVVTKPHQPYPEDYAVFMQGLVEQIKPLFPGAEKQIVPVNAKPGRIQAFGQTLEIPITGMDELNNLVIRLLPKALADAYTRSAKTALKEKHDKAIKVLGLESAAVAGIAASATAMGFDDTAALILSELGMFALIGKIYNFRVDFHKSATAVLGAVSTKLMSTIGKMVAHWILVIATGGTSVVVEAGVRVAIAESMILPIGRAFIGVMDRFANGELSKDEATKAMEKLLIDSKKKQDSNANKT